MKIPKNLGMLLLSIWLILMGALPLLDVSLGKFSVLLHVLAIAAGVLLLLGR